MALGQSFSFGVFLITITSFFDLDAPKYLERFLFLMKASNLQCSTHRVLQLHQVSLHSDEKNNSFISNTFNGLSVPWGQVNLALSKNIDSQFLPQLRYIITNFHAINDVSVHLLSAMYIVLSVFSKRVIFKKVPKSILHVKLICVFFHSFHLTIVQS